MKIEVGMYTRTKYGIGKIDETRMFMNEFQFHLDINVGRILNVNDNTYWNTQKDIIKEPSFKLIDLIEVGDYVNGVEVEEITDTEIMLVDTHLYIDKNVANKLIESVVTHEQFESVSYKVGDKE